MRKNKLKIINLMILLMMVSVGFQPVSAGNKKLMSIKKAKVFAQRAIVESVIGLKIKSTSLFTDTNSDEYKVESKVAATIKGIMFDSPKYDKTKDIAMITAKIRLGSVKNIIGKPIHYEDIVISRVGFATSSREFAPQLAALRAAELNAYDEMAQVIVGQNIQSNTKMKDFVLESDEVKTKTLAALWGAQVADFGWEEDGNAFIKLKLNAKWVKDVMGNTFQYSQDNYIEVTGYGSPINELNESKSQSFGRQNNKVEEVTFDIPGFNQGSSQSSGGASSLQ